MNPARLGENLFAPGELFHFLILKKPFLSPEEMFYYFQQVASRSQIGAQDIVGPGLVQLPSRKGLSADTTTLA